MKLIRFLILAFSIFAQTPLKADSVVCIHGFIRSYRSMIPMGNALEKEGLNVYLWDYQSRSLTIEEHAANLVQVLKAIAVERPGESIHFVTHSLGGVITKTALNHPECPYEAKKGRAVLLAPPMQGSSMARAVSHITPVRWVFGEKAGQQLMTFDNKDMSALGAFPPTVDVLVISGKKGRQIFFNEQNDGKVSIEETRLDTSHEHRVIHASHSWIMTSRESIQMTKAFLLKK
jgi:pimeloyl-ACP methyl ester carboxylesterase